jgi:hypothetical protein
MDSIKSHNNITLCTSDYLKVIKIAGYTGNLALTTFVRVSTDTNTCKVHYQVNSWNDKHRRFTKNFENYASAFAYYMRLYLKFAKK